jgi:NTP pyrophosphatase (non-canonical NTP hydrolase)
MFEEQGMVASWLLSLAPLGPFPDTKSAINRIVEEWYELEKAEDKDAQAKELADVMITCLALASMLNVDIQRYVRYKIDINNRREWRQDPETHNYYHIKKAE